MNPLDQTRKRKDRDSEMKILWITAKNRQSHGLSPVYGLSESLSAMGHQVTVVLATEEATGRERNIKYIRNPFKKLRYFKLKVAFCLLWWVAWEKPDFIILDWQSAFVPILLVILSKLGLYENNLIHDIRTIPIPTDRTHREKVFRMCVRFSKRHFRGITTITEALRNKICSEYDIPLDKVGVWNSGVDLKLFFPRNGETKKKQMGLEDKFVVFYHGSVGHKRGVVEVVEAFSLLRKGEIHLFILGSGTELPRVMKLREMMGLENVHVHPRVDYREVPEYIAIGDVCIVPLPAEECWSVSSPLKLMEYLAMGKPIILTEILAHREVIRRREEALFIPDIRPETIAASIRRAYEDRSKLYKLGEAGLWNARENWSWDIQAGKLIRYLESV